MTKSALLKNLIDVFRDAGNAHHVAFEAVDGEDPDWPIWYADHLHQPLLTFLSPRLTKSKIVYCLMAAETERQAVDPDGDWASFYAAHFLERFAPAELPADDKLALYYFPTCPFCQRVLAAIDRLGLKVELQNIHENPDYFDKLVGARGRATVPVLHIEHPNGEEQYMPESSDIIDYLQEAYG